MTINFQMVEDSFSTGYNWCVDTIKMSQHSQLANDLEINKAVMYLRYSHLDYTRMDIFKMIFSKFSNDCFPRQKDFQNAVDTLKAFEKQEPKVASTAATNLSFLFFLQVSLALLDVCVPIYEDYLMNSNWSSLFTAIHFMNSQI